MIDGEGLLDGFSKSTPPSEQALTKQDIMQTIHGIKEHLGFPSGNNLIVCGLCDEFMAIKDSLSHLKEEHPDWWVENVVDA